MGPLQNQVEDFLVMLALSAGAGLVGYGIACALTFGWEIWRKYRRPL